MHRIRTALVVGVALTLTTSIRAQQAEADRVNATLGLEESTIFRLGAYIEPNQPILARVPLQGVEEIVFLEPHSVRADSYQILVQQDDGQLVEAPPSPVQTLRGYVVGAEGSVVAGTLHEGGLHLRIAYADGEEFWVEPIGNRVFGFAGDQYVAYHGEDVVESGAICGNNDAVATNRELHDFQLLGDDLVLNGGALCVAELACDADFEYFQTWGSVAGVENRINSIINTVNVQYESEVGITHAITTIIVRTTSEDPYSRKKADQLLNEFRNEWENNQSSIPRDVAHLFTGKALSGSTIGIAYVGAVCSNFGYGLVESDFVNNFACSTDLSAHELGHNWGANHCACSNFTMNAGITCANQFSPSATIPVILSFRDSIGCLGNCGGTGTPTGACCLPDDSCSIETSADCAAAGGVYQGDGTDCSPNPCGSGGSGEAPVTAASVQKGTIVSGFLEDLYDSDDSSVLYSARRQGPRYLSDLQVTHSSPFASVSQLDVTTEIGADVSGVDTTVSLRNVSSNSWDVIDSYAQPTGDTVRVTANVPNPNDYIAANGDIIVRVETLKSGNGGAHTMRVDQSQVIVTQ